MTRDDDGVNPTTTDDILHRKMNRRRALGTAAAAGLGVAVIAAGVGGYVAGGQTAPAKEVTTTMTQTVTQTNAVTQTATVTATQSTATPTASTSGLKVGVIYITPLEEPWNTVLNTAMTWAKQNLGIQYAYQENVSSDDAERVLTGFAQNGAKVLLAHSWYPDAIKAVATAFPNVNILGAGGGVELRTIYPFPAVVPTNVGHYDSYNQEAAFLAGLAAAKMSKNNSIGVVAAFPVTNANRYINGFIMGARYINPKIAAKVSWMESWYDPPKQKEAAIAQINAGADVIFSERLGAETAAQDQGVYAIGNFVDTSSTAPKAVIGSILWDLKTTIREIIVRTASGTFVNKEYFLGMAQGGADVTLTDLVPRDVKNLVSSARQDILNGAILVPNIEKKPDDYWGL